MLLEPSSESRRGASSPSLGEGVAPPNQFTGRDVAAILRERGWLEANEGTVARVFEPRDVAEKGPVSEEAGYNKSDLDAWLAGAAALLGPHAADGSTSLTASRDALAELLSLIFRYDARDVLRLPDSHVVLAREGARDVVRELAHLVLAGPEIDSDRFKEIVNALKERLPYRGRELFHPIRLALAGRAGEGALDRVILLVDRVAGLAFHAPVKSTRQRMLEFCAALD